MALFSVRHIQICELSDRRVVSTASPTSHLRSGHRRRRSTMSTAPRKRERENPCGVCSHYHKFEQGEVCGVCGHRMATSLDPPTRHNGYFPTEILPEFLFLGSYDTASRGEILKILGITHILNTVPACQNLYKNSFTYHCLQDNKSLQFDDAIQFLEQCEKDKERALVHCMTGKSRSPAIIIAYLMKCKGWRLAQSFQWVKDRRPQIELSEVARQQLLEFEQRIFGSNEPAPVQALPPPETLPTFGFGFQGTTDSAPVPVFNQSTAISIFERTGPSACSTNFVFGAGRTTEQTMENSAVGMSSPNGNETAMDSS